MEQEDYMTAFQTDEWGRFYEQEYSDTEKDIAAIDIGIQAIERNKAAIDECNVCIGGLSKLTGFRGNEAAFLQGQINAYKNILKILDGEE